MAGSISTLGIGSGLELQSILEQLREVDQKVVDTNKTEVESTKAQLDEFTVVKNKLLTMKSKALDLSLSSTFLGRTVSSANEDVMTATAVDGATVQSSNITVSSLATKSSWESSGGFAADTTKIYIPTTQQSTTGVTDPAVGVVAATGETLTITYGASKTIAVVAAGDLTMNQLVDEINNHADNQGGPGASGRYVTAETYVSSGTTYLRIKTDTVGGTGETNRVAVSETLAALSFAAPDAVFSYKLGSGDTISVSVAADTTLSGLVDLINDDADNPGITASMIDKGDGATPYRLMLTADETGEDNRISILSYPGDIPMTEKQGAGAASLNAQLALDGITFQRQSNTISDLMNGITLTLVDTGSSTVSVADDTGGTVDLIKGLIEAYNDMVQEIGAKSTYDEETKEFGMLSRTTLRDIPFTLQSLMTSTVKADSDGNITSLFDMGLEFNRDGTITIDEEMLTEAIATYGSGVEAFFLGDDEEDITGFGDLINDRLRVLTVSTGQIEAEKNEADARIAALEQNIEAEIARLDKKYEIMAKQFSELDRYMKQMTSISDFLTGQFSALSGSGSSGGKK